MRIIRPGVDPGDLFWGRCKRCGCVVEVCREDDDIWIDHSYDDVPRPYVSCPTAECPRIIRLKSGKAPVEKYQ